MSSQNSFLLAAISIKCELKDSLWINKYTSASTTSVFPAATPSPLFNEMMNYMKLPQIILEQLGDIAVLWFITPKSKIIVSNICVKQTLNIMW